MENESTVKDLLDWKGYGEASWLDGEKEELTDEDRTRIDNFYYGRYIQTQY